MNFGLQMKPLCTRCCLGLTNKPLSLWHLIRSLRTIDKDLTYQRRRFIAANTDLRPLTLTPSFPASSSPRNIVITHGCISSPWQPSRRFRSLIPDSGPIHSDSNADSVDGTDTRTKPVEPTTAPPATAPPVPSPKNDDLWRLLRLVEPEKAHLLSAVGLLFISSGVSMSVPFFMGRVIDIINSSVQSSAPALDTLDPLAMLMLGVFVAGALANAGRVYLVNSSGQRIVAGLRVSVLSAILRKDLSFFDRTRTGELVSRLSTDTTVVGQSLTQNLSDGLRSSLYCAVSAGMMLYISPELSGMSLAMVAPVAIFSIVYGRHLRNLSKQLQDRVAAATQVAEERISNIRTVRAFAQEMHEIANYEGKNSSVLDVAYKEARARAVFFGFNALVGNIIVLVVFYYGGMMMQNSAITVGEISSFLVYATYMGFGLGGLSTFYSELMRGVGASTRLWKLLDSEHEASGDAGAFRASSIPLRSLHGLPGAFPDTGLESGIIPSTEVLQGDICFKGVSFSYPTRPDSPVFTDLDLHVPAGKVTAVVGKSGSGKSTLAALLLRLYSPTSGCITIRDIDIDGVNPTWLRSNIGTVAQEPILFSSSIADNIRYGSNKTAHAVDVIEAAEKANVHDFVTQLKDGYDTLVGERGVTLSGGQKQRVAIARAILKDPSILILDEATSALDSESEALVREALERFLVGRTVVVIAHRLSTIRHADRIFVLSGGGVAESGSFTELMQNQKGIFRSLVQKQALSSS